MEFTLQLGNRISGTVLAGPLSSQTGSSAAMKFGMVRASQLVGQWRCFVTTLIQVIQLTYDVHTSPRPKCKFIGLWLEHRL